MAKPTEPEMLLTKAESFFKGEGWTMDVIKVTPLSLRLKPTADEDVDVALSDRHLLEDPTTKRLARERRMSPAAFLHWLRNSETELEKDKDRR